MLLGVGAVIWIYRLRAKVATLKEGVKDVQTKEQIHNLSDADLSNLLVKDLSTDD